MISKWTAVLCAFLLAEALATREVLNSSSKTSTKLKLTGTEGTTIASHACASAFVEGPGKVDVHVEAVTVGMTEVANKIIHVVKDAIFSVEKGEDVIALAETCASAYGFAIAEAYADVIVKLASTSKHGKGCGSAFSDAVATATAFARVVVDVLARASNKIAFASAKGAAEAIAAATAKAFAKAEAYSCGEGIFDAKIVASSFGESFVEPYALLFASAYAAVAADVAVAKIVLDVSSGVLEASYSDGSTFADIVGKVDVEGGTESGGSTEEVPAPSLVVEPSLPKCPSAFKACCRSGTGRSTCTCRVGCKATPLRHPHIPHGGLVIKVVEKTYRSSIDLAVGDRCEC